MKPRGARRTVGSVGATFAAAPVAALLALSALLAIAAGHAPEAQEAEPAPLPLTVMTFNIRTSLNSAEDGDNGWPHRRALVADTIARIAPEVAGLQEALADQLDYLSAKLPDYRWIGVDRGLNGGRGLSEHVPIFYRHRELLPVESGTFWLSPTPGGPTGAGFRRRVSRIVTWAHFHHVASDRRFYVYNTHLTLRQGDRQVNSAAMIAERVAALPADTPVLAIGDFNATAENSATWRAATAAGLRDAWLLADRTIGPARTSSDFRPPERANEGRIDWILVGGPIGVRSVDTVTDHDNGRYPSDHYPVVARVVLH